MLTPIAKSWPSQWCLEANDLAIQVHGGYGYTREYAVEQYYRDNRLNPIHEGTHGIQALDLLGRKVVMADGAGLAALADAVRITVAERARGGRRGGRRWAPTLDAALTRLVDVTATIHGADLDPAARLANASVYLEAAGHVVVAWMWLGAVPRHRRARRRRSTRASARPRGTSSASSCRRPGRSSTCSRASTRRPYETDPGWL